MIPLVPSPASPLCPRHQPQPLPLLQIARTLQRLLQLLLPPHLPPLRTLPPTRLLPLPLPSPPQRLWHLLLLHWCVTLELLLVITMLMLC